MYKMWILCGIFHNQKYETLISQNNYNLHCGLFIVSMCRNLNFNLHMINYVLLTLMVDFKIVFLQSLSLPIDAS